MTHPRGFRVDRQEPGIDWRPNNLSYHRTAAQALAAAQAFLNGEGKHYAASTWRNPTRDGRRAIVTKRIEAGRYPRWEHVVRLENINGRTIGFDSDGKAA